MPALQQLPVAGAVIDTWRALLTGPWCREIPVRLRRSRFLVVLYVASGLADANGRIPEPSATEKQLTSRLAHSCGARPQTVARILAAAVTAGAIAEPSLGRYALTTTAVPNWTAALAYLDQEQTRP
ncbi:hypothetical protein [Streptomyces chryseus]|uniref:Uncharacterized protein n=2 Tax=Streptomyces chryseus TaxID=68186 RepID=A0ABQ3DEB0_9ACTN|nr:hypothetical protein [Streptomyces chryseus]GHA83107.1 hypothetical protein GCM10010346_01790 [Streptomyces chryseus]